MPLPIPPPYPLSLTPTIIPPPPRSPTPQQLPLPTLAPGTIMHHLMRKDIAIDTKAPPTRLALIPPTLTHITLPLALALSPSALTPPASKALPLPATERLTSPPTGKRTRFLLRALCHWRWREVFCWWW